MKVNQTLRVATFMGMCTALVLGLPVSGGQWDWLLGVALVVFLLSRWPGVWTGAWGGLAVAAGILLLAQGQVGLLEPPVRLARAFELVQWLLLLNGALVMGWGGTAGAVIFAWLADLFVQPAWVDLDPWSAAADLTLQLVVVSMVKALASGRRMADQQARRLRQQACTDPLTGLLNHRAIHQELERALAQADAAPVSILMVDLDRFKRFNDTMGHQAGNEVLCRVAQVLTECMEPGMAVGRYGGDEFLVVLPGADDRTAVNVGERIIAGLARERFSPGRNRPFAVGASVGVATYPDDGLSVEELIQVADRDMYAAKATRGNLVEGH